MRVPARETTPEFVLSTGVLVQCPPATKPALESAVVFHIIHKMAGDLGASFRNGGGLGVAEVL